MSLNDYKYSPDQLLNLASVHCSENQKAVSIGMALDKLSSVSKIGKELDGDCDGLDALCYHLSGPTCEKAIESLQAVLKRFETEYGK